MRPHAPLLALGLALVSCGGAPEAAPVAPTVVVASAVVAAAPPPAPPASPFDTTLPRGAALRMSFDPGKVAGPEALFALRLMGRPVEHALESALALQPGDLGVAWLAAAGFDGARPIAIAVLGPTPGDRRAIDALRALVPAKDPQGNVVPGVSFAALRDAVDHLGTLVQARVIVPALDAARAKKMIGALLAGADFVADGPDAYGLRDLRVEIGGDAATVVIDLAAGRGARDAIAALRARVPGGPHDDPPALEGHAVRVVESPVAMADIGFVTGLERTAAALSGTAVAPDQRERIAALGLWEASQSYTLAGSAAGAYFDRIDLAASYPADLVLTTDPGPAFVAPPDEAWKPGTSITARAGLWAAFDVSLAFFQAWPFPGVPRGGGLDVRDFVSLVREAGWSGYAVSVPSMALASLLGLSPTPDVFPSLAPVRRFERMGTMVPMVKDDVLSPVFFVVLPQGASRAAAACALADSVPCRDGLKVGATTRIKESYVRLAAVDKRFVVLVSRAQASVEVDLALHTVGPVWIASPPMGEWIWDRQHDLRALGQHLIGSVERRGPSIVGRLAIP